MRATPYVIAAVVMGAGATAAAEPFPHIARVVAVKSVTASSTYADKGNAYAPTKTLAYETRGGTMDQPEVVMWSAWCEGKEDEGIGESVTITLAEPTQLDSVKIAAGVWRTEKLFAGNNQITSLEVIADGKSHKVAPKGRAWTELKLGAKVTTLVFKIAAVKKGKMNDSCLSGIDLVGKGARLVPSIGGDAKAIAALPGALKEIQAALAPPHKGLEAVLEFPFSHHDVDGFFMGGGDAVTTKTYKEVATACAVYAKAPADADWTDPKGCPQQGPDNPDDPRPGFVTVMSADTVLVQFNSSREVGVTWLLHWKDRWRLKAIDYSGF